MRSRPKGSGFLLVLSLALAAGCDRVPSIRPYDERTQADENSAPFVIVGVAQGDLRIGEPVASSLFQTKLHVHRASVRIENVLRGNIREHSIALYYFAFEHLNTSHPPLIFGNAPSRRLIAVRKEGAVYRTAIDGWNCAPPIVTGAHPTYTVDPNASLIQTEIDLNMTRGEGPVDGGDWADKIRGIIGLGPEGTSIETLRHLALTE